MTMWNHETLSFVIQATIRQTLFVFMDGITCWLLYHNSALAAPVLGLRPFFVLPENGVNKRGRTGCLCKHALIHRQSRHRSAHQRERAIWQVLKEAALAVSDWAPSGPQPAWRTRQSARSMTRTCTAVPRPISAASLWTMTTQRLRSSSCGWSHAAMFAATARQHAHPARSADRLREERWSACMQVQRSCMHANLHGHAY